MSTYTVSDWVAWMGGNAPAATFLGVGVTMVCKMKAQNRIPAKHHRKIREHCAAGGLDFEPEEPAEHGDRDAA